MRRGGPVEKVRRRRGGQGGGGGGGGRRVAPRSGEGHGVGRCRGGVEGHGRGTQRRGEDGRAGRRAEVRLRVPGRRAGAGRAPRSGEAGWGEDARRRREGRRCERRRRVRNLRLRLLPRRRLLHDGRARLLGPVAAAATRAARRSGWDSRGDRGG